MGWTSYHARYYKNGKIDRKRELDEQFTHSIYSVVKSQMVGAVYYAAIKLTQENKPDTVFAVICHTSVDMKDYFNFAYKDMDETMGPYECRCPISILKLLTPTESEWANNWRKKCYEFHEKKKNKLTPNTLPVGTKIRFITWDGRVKELVKREPNYQFRRAWWYVPATHTYCPANRIPENFEIIA